MIGIGEGRCVSRYAGQSCRSSADCRDGLCCRMDIKGSTCEDGCYSPDYVPMGNFEGREFWRLWHRQRRNERRRKFYR
ncbi:unnamed protein product [Protopolystoma xenopodis]|uniref:Uncharacterized protein n=1 Tax=Protopolystoma xenopodis TaxID=117903 RepID=A0A448WAF7_9PLAT|nr:unnamed protein product [Protopolystoma xenopodis]